MKVRFTRNFLMILVLDVLLVTFSFYLAHLIRFDFSIPSWASDRFSTLLPFSIAIKIACFFIFDLYRGMWRYTGLSDLMNVGKASFASTMLLILFVLFTTGFQGVPRSVFVIDWCLTLITIISLRVATRICFEKMGSGESLGNLVQSVILALRQNKAVSQKNILIIGAGNCGEKLIREIQGNVSARYRVCGFLDDDYRKIGRKIHGVTVLAEIEQLSSTITSTGAEEVIIAIPSISPKRMRGIVDLCKKAGVRHKTVPNMSELIDGKITVNSIRDVEYRDLLRRKPINLEEDKIWGYIKDKTVLVTGGGGSIGQGLCKQICRYEPRRLVIVEISESPLYEIELVLKKEFPGTEICASLSDIRNKNEIELIFDQFRPDIVFHAAAYKHVPMLEAHPWKAIENNILGTWNVVEATDKFGCRKFVFVSTDKAVNPTNIMGASKRISELIVQNKNVCAGSGTSFLIVRFGNVIGSVGSVIPLFKRQIREGGPVTVTHPEIIRFFMLIPEACQLILQAGTMGRGGEIFILEMGEPVRIDEMARDLIRFSGFEPEVDIPIVYTGLRPGEKLYEELMTEGENVAPTRHEKIMVLNSKDCTFRSLDEEIAVLAECAKARDRGEIVEKFQKIVPEYHPAEN